MKYKDEVPKSAQIRLDQFQILPGDKIWLMHKRKLFAGEVTEVGAANPEYVLGGPNAKGAGVIIWRKEEREACEKFLSGGGHKPVLIRFKKSMWVWVEFRTRRKIVKKKLYTYDLSLQIQRFVNRLFLNRAGEQEK